MKNIVIKRFCLLISVISVISMNNAISQVGHSVVDREKIDKMRDRDLQPQKILDVIKIEKGMRVGEAGAGYGYFTFKISNRVGNSGVVYANDIDPEALKLITSKCNSANISNIKTVFGKKDDPLFPESNLDVIVVFDCLFEFSDPQTWIQNTKRYLKPNGKLVIIDPDPQKMNNSGHFLDRKQIIESATKSGYFQVSVNDSFLKSHLILVFQN